MKKPAEAGLWESDSTLGYLVDLVVSTGTYAQHQDDLGTVDAVDDTEIACSYPATASEVAT